MCIAQPVDIALIVAAHVHFLAPGIVRMRPDAVDGDDARV